MCRAAWLAYIWYTFVTIWCIAMGAFCCGGLVLVIVLAVAAAFGSYVLFGSTLLLVVLLVISAILLALGAVLSFIAAVFSDGLAAGSVVLMFRYCPHTGPFGLPAWV